MRFALIGDFSLMFFSSPRFCSLLISIAGIALIEFCVRVSASFEFPDLYGDGGDDLLLEHGETDLCEISPESNDLPELLPVDNFPRVTSGSRVAACGDFNSDDSRRRLMPFGKECGTITGSWWWVES